MNAARLYRRGFQRLFERNLSPADGSSTLSLGYLPQDELVKELEAIVDTAIAITDADMGNMRLLNAQSGCLQIVAQRGFKPPYLNYWGCAIAGQGTCGTALKLGRRVVVEDVTQGPIFSAPEGLQVLREAGVRAQQSTPLINRAGQVIGMLSTHYQQPGAPDERALRLFDLLARQTVDIIERMQAEEALREKEEWLRLAVDGSRLGLWDWNIARNELAWSDRCREIHGVAPDQALSFDYFLGLLHADDRSRIESDIRRALDQHGDYDAVMRVIGDDARERWVAAKGRGFYGPDGKAIRMVGTAQDVTELKHAELDLAAREAQYRAVIDTTTDGFWMTDGQGRILATNDAYVQRSGYSREELLAMRVADLEAGEALDETAAHIEKIRSEGSDLFESQHRAKHGGTWHVEVNAAYWPQAGNRFFVFIRDLERRRKAEEQLREIEQRFRATFDQAAVGIAHVSPQGHWIRVNQKLCDILAYTREELVRRSYDEIHFLEDRQASRKAMQQLLAGAVETHAAEKRFLRMDGGMTWVDLTLSLVRKADNQPDYFIAVAQDIRARKQSEAELRQLHVELEQVMRVQVATQTAAVIAHELNQPLNAMATYSDAAVRMLRNGHVNPEKLQHALDGCGQQAERAGQVVRELLQFLNQGEAKPEAVDLVECARHALAFFEDGHSSTVRADLEVEPNPKPVWANALHVKKVLVNLVQNSIEAMANAAVPMQHISIRIKTEGDLAQVTVSDTGPGLNQDIRQQIFTPFFTTKRGGIGMGLSICRSLIETHGGHLWAESGDGQGATFHFTLPLLS